MAAHDPSPRLTILRNLSASAVPDATGDRIEFKELTEAIRRGEIGRYLLRFKEARLLSHNLALESKPFLTSLLVRLVSRGACVAEDQQGVRRTISLSYLVQLLGQYGRDWAGRRTLLSRVQQDVQALWGACTDHPAQYSLREKASPVYLRTDLVFGLQSGGSVGHTAGVLNHLGEFLAPPIFITTDRIPTVNEDIETLVLRPSGRFRDFAELPGLAFNETLKRALHERLASQTLSFLYQRYCLHNYAGVQAARGLGIPFVLEFNGSEVWVARHWGTPLIYEELAERIELLNLQAAAVIVVVSQAIQNELVARGIPSENILVNPNGVDPERYAPLIDGSTVRARYGFDGRTVIGFIGTFGRWHGAEVLADAFGRLLARSPELRERVRLMMIGDGQMMPAVKERLHTHGVGDACVLTGLVPQAQGPMYLAACDLLVSPHVPNPDGSPFFGSPTKLFEYMAMGKGIVASNLDQIGEVLSHDHTAWLVPPGDPEALAQGLRLLIADPARRTRLGEAARREVTAKHTWRAHTKRIVDAVRDRCG